MYLLITVLASLLVGLVLVYLVLVIFDREPAAPGSTRTERQVAKRDARMRIDQLNQEIAERDELIVELRSALADTDGDNHKTTQ